MFATVSLLLIDVALTTLALTPTRLKPDALGLLDGWDVLKAGLAAVALWIAAVRLDSRLPALFGLIVLAIALQDETGWHFTLAQRIFERTDLPATVEGIPTTSLIEAAILTLLALIFTALLWVFPAPAEIVRTLRRNLFLLLALMFVFAVVVDLINDAAARSWVEDVEETGERVTLTLIAGYATWLVAGSAVGHRTLR